MKDHYSKLTQYFQVSLSKEGYEKMNLLQAGSLEKLVDSLASDTGELESTYINVFLNTYRTFASAKQVLNLLTERLVTQFVYFPGFS